MNDNKLSLLLIFLFFVSSFILFVNLMKRINALEDKEYNYTK